MDVSDSGDLKVLSLVKVSFLGFHDQVCFNSAIVLAVGQACVASSMRSRSTMHFWLVFISEVLTTSCNGKVCDY